MSAQVLAGAPASPGTAVGHGRLLGSPAADPGEVGPERRPAELRRALKGLEGAAEELRALAGRLRDEGREADAELVETSVVLAEDPELSSAIERAVGQRGLAAPAAILAAAADGGAAIAALPDPMLAARSADVLSLGRRAARIAAGGETRSQSADQGDVILVASELGPADVSELGAEVKGIALAGGGVTAHAAIVARSLGIPMAVGLGDELMQVREGELIVVDGTRGVALPAPAFEDVAQARAATQARVRARARAIGSSTLPAITTDGRRVAVLVNAAGAQEVVAGFEAGADGVGLLRTELAFLDARDWPCEEEHRRVLEPVLAAAGDRPVTVRVLDFGGDKTPPFLAGERRRGIELLASAPEALEAQLRAILAARGGVALRILVPMVRGPADLVLVRERLLSAVAAVGADMPALGAMIETREAVSAAAAIAREADFMSLGTNDLACDALGIERFSAARGLAHHPRVLGLVGQTVWAARNARAPIEVCGEAASDSLTVPVLVGLGVDELSVGAARVGLVRSWIRAIAGSDAREAARLALQATSIADVAEAVRPVSSRLELLEVGDAAGESLDGSVRVGAVGSQP